MLTRLEVDGFKSLRDFAIDLEPFTVLIGPNSAGKSNILEAIALLSRLARVSPVEALQQGRGRILDQFSRLQLGHAAAIRLAVEGIEPEPATRDGEAQTRFRADVTLHRTENGDSAIQAIELQSQSLRGLSEAEDEWARSHPEFRPWLEHKYPHQLKLSFDFPSGFELNPRGDLRLKVRRTEFDALFVIKDSIESVLIELHAANLREPSESLAARQLAPDMRNLPSALSALDPPILGSIRSALSAIVPGLATFEIVSNRELLSIDFVLSSGERIPARLASDGTLRVLALLVAAFAPNASKTICIEEPENGIYPRRLRDLLTLLHERTLPLEGGPLPPQIILTTHSPVAIAALRHAPECIRFVDTVRRNGERVTRVRRLGTGEDHGRTTISPREIEELLDLGTEEDDA